MRRILPPALAFLALSLGGCAAPRAVLWDGTSVPRWHVEGNVAGIGSVPFATVGAVGRSAKDAVEAVASKGDSLDDSITYRRSVRSLVAASLDMPGWNYMTSVHMGLGGGAEIGYRREGGANAFDLRWQFLDAQEHGWNGGTAIQYSWCSFDLPSYLGDLQEILGYRFERKDVIVPLVFSRPFGEKGKYGSFGGSILGGWSQITYGFDPDGLYKRSGMEWKPLEKAPDQTTTYWSWGASVLVRGGYKWVWGFAGLTAVWQDYGSFQVPGTDPISLSGLTVQPAIGIEFRI